MNIRKIYSVAKSIQPFVKGHGKITTESIYKIIMTNDALNFIRQLFTIEDIPVLVFTTYEIANGNDNLEIINEIKSSLFYFCTYEFGDTENDIDCPECSGEGRVDCADCDGRGSIDCDECGGDGVFDDDETCNQCDGEGYVDCDYCTNGRTECDECGGRGSKTYYDAVPYDLSIYTSYNNDLKEIIEQKSIRNEPVVFESSPKKTLLLYMENVDVNNEWTESISEKYANNEYFGDILSPEEVSLTFMRDKIYMAEYDLAPPDKFYN